MDHSSAGLAFAPRAAFWLYRNLERLLVCLFLTAFSLALVLQVFMRFVLRDPLPWPEELSRYLLIWTAFVGSSLAVQEGRAININVLPMLASGAVEKAFFYIMHIGFLLFCLTGIWFASWLVLRIHQSAQVSPAMGIPMWMVYCAAPFGLGLAAFRTVEAMILGTRENVIAESF
jgi:TRAP-type C4-dicarboxylate transport system permease small subunit